MYVSKRICRNAIGAVISAQPHVDIACDGAKVAHPQLGARVTKMQVRRPIRVLATDHRANFVSSTSVHQQHRLNVCAMDKAMSVTGATDNTQWMREAAVDLIESNYKSACTRPTDIHEHLPTLRAYTEKCRHVTECGVRAVVSSWAFAAGLLGKPDAKLIQVDLVTNDHVVEFGTMARLAGIPTVFYQQSDLDCPIEDTDLLFIDTWHVYGHLKRELSRWHSHVRKYIIMHDTTVDEWRGETLRCGWNATQQSVQTGIPVEEITRGLWPAVEEFIQQHPEWTIEQRYTNCNGLTVLKRAP